MATKCGAVDTDSGDSSLMHAIQDIDRRRESVASLISAETKSEFGQFMTPSVIASFMAGMFADATGKDIRLLDAGAGIGSLTVAFIEQAGKALPRSFRCVAWELDPCVDEGTSFRDAGRMRRGLSRHFHRDSGRGLHPLGFRRRQIRHDAEVHACHPESALQEIEDGFGPSQGLADGRRRDIEPVCGFCRACSPDVGRRWRTRRHHAP